MKKKNLIILLIFPFLISVFCIITVNTTYNKIDVDISYIDWKYNDMEGWVLTTGDYQYLLEANGVNQRHYKATGDTQLIWSVKNEDPTLTEPCAEIVEQNGKFYLNTLRAGNVIVTCTNKKGNVSRQMTLVIYEEGTAAILFYPKITKAGTRVDPTLYYGEYDHRINTYAVIDMNLMVVPASEATSLNVECTPNVSFDINTGKIAIQPVSGGNSSASITLSHPEGLAAPQTFSFEIVDEGVNVYTYDDLLYCTNGSSKTGGHIAVLRKSFESIANAYTMDENGNRVLRSNNVECFGNYNPQTNTCVFGQDEIHHFTTSYNRKFIDQWNTFAANNSKYSDVSDQINVGLHVQKDFYGNGYTINLNNLVFINGMKGELNQETGETVYVPDIRSTDPFQGPLKIYCLGDPNVMPMVSLFGQDNIGMLIEGDGITLNDVDLKNCEFGDRRENLKTAGTVLEVAGDNVTVKNSRLSNGKNVVRSFSSMNLQLQNCLLSYAQNFLLVTGANEYVAVNADALSSFQKLDGSVQQAVISEFMAPNGTGNEIVNQFLQEAFKDDAKRKAMKESLLSIQSALNQEERVKGNYKGSTNVQDCLFYQSGIAAICMESLFNSPFLEMGSPSYITGLFNITESFGVTLVPYVPTGVSGISYPVQLNVSGDTRFYDFKTADEVELTGLMEENISYFASLAGPMIGFDSNQVITLDTLFPLKSMLMSEASGKGLTYKDSDKTYVNIPIAFYGGGLNLSQVTFNGYKHAAQMSSNVKIDILEDYLRKPDGASYKEQIRKSVIAISGYAPFQFRFIKNGFLFGQAQNMIDDLIANAKEN